MCLITPLPCLSGVSASTVLTPAHQAELEEEVVMVGVEDFDHKPVEIVALDAHPGEAAEEGEVQEKPPGSAGRLTAAGSQVLRDEEGEVQEEDGTQQVHVDVHACDLVSLLAPGEPRGRELSTTPGQHPQCPKTPCGVTLAPVCQIRDNHQAEFPQSLKTAGVFEHPAGNLAKAMVSGKEHSTLFQPGSFTVLLAVPPSGKRAPNPYLK